jgi:predicted TIM-barrel fold metal-dependent hydrolase
MQIIDTHCHVVSPDTAKYPLAPIGGTQSDWSSERPTTPAQMIAAMDAAGVAKSVLVQASTAYGHDSSYCAEGVEAHPDRFTGVFSIDPLEDDAVKKAEYWLSRGMTGMRVFTTGSTMPGQQTWLDDERAFPTWELAGKKRIPIAVQMTAQGIPLLIKIVERFPDTFFLLDHLGRPVITDGPPYAKAASLFELASYPSILLKITSRTAEHSQTDKATPETFFPLLVKTFGADRLMWGSNFPAAEGTLSALLAASRKVIGCLPEQDQEAIFGGTAKRIYPALA